MSNEFWIALLVDSTKTYFINTLTKLTFYEAILCSH